MEKYGGEYLARGGQLSIKEDHLWSPTRKVLIRFASSEQAEIFYQSAEYQRVLGVSKQSAERTVFIFDGM